MTFTIDVKSDINKIAKHMDNLERKQLPFGISLTLNKLALLSQEAIGKRISVIFNNSKKWWDKGQRTGVKVAFCNKYNLVASVYTRAHFAHIQEEGGIKKPRNSSMIAVPTSNVPRRNRSSRALKMEQGNRSVFKLGKSIYQKIYGNRLLRLYSLTEQAKIKPRLGFKKTAISIFWPKV